MHWLFQLNNEENEEKPRTPREKVPQSLLFEAEHGELDVSFLLLDPFKEIAIFQHMIEKQSVKLSPLICLLLLILAEPQNYIHTETFSSGSFPILVLIFSSICFSPTRNDWF